MTKSIDCKKFYYIFILCSAVFAVVMSTFYDYRDLYAKGDFYTWFVTAVADITAFGIANFFMFQVTALGRFIYLKIRYSITNPLYLFPFLIGRMNGKLTIKIGKKPSVVYCDFLDEEYLSKHSREEIEKILKEGIIARKAARYIVGIIIFIICICNKPISSIGIVIILIEFETIDMICERKFHGDNYKLRNISKGNADLYLNVVYDEKDIINWYNCEINRNYVLGIVKRELIKRIYEDDYSEPLYVRTIVEKLCAEPEEISLSPDDKEIDIVTLYVFWALFSEDNDRICNIRNVVLRMKIHFGRYSGLWRDFFDWFIQTIDYYQWEKKVEIKNDKQLLIKYDSWGSIPGEYMAMLNEVNRKIENYKCEIKKEVNYE